MSGHAKCSLSSILVVVVEEEEIGEKEEEYQKQKRITSEINSNSNSIDQIYKSNSRNCDNVKYVKSLAMAAIILATLVGAIIFCFIVCTSYKLFCMGMN